MEASPVNVIQYFDGSKQGIIPLFQRPYSWDQSHWSALWNDLMAQYQEDDRSSHFMGAIVTVPVKSVPVGVGKHLVIDGQQRLTTLSLLLAAIRERAVRAGDDATAGIIGDLLVNRHYKSPDDLKLVPTQVDRAAYNALLLGKELDAYEETRIVQGFRYFLKQLAGVDDNEMPIRPDMTFQAIQQSLQVVMISLGEADDPYLIFESLNHKGKPLSQADLVRNYVLMRFHHSTAAGGEQEAVYEEFWRPMEHDLGEAMPEFLRHYGMRLGRNVRKGDIYTASKNEFEKSKAVDEVREKLSAMKLAANGYRRFIDPESDTNAASAAMLRGLRELDSTVFYPLMLQLWSRVQEGSLMSADFVHALQTLESFYVRRLVCAVPTNALNKMMLELCANLPDEAPHLWLRERLTQGGGGRRWPVDSEFFDAMVGERLYPRRGIVRYVLIGLEESYEHKEPVDPVSASIEHIMPQTLSVPWEEMLGSNAAEVHERWLHTLGNLTLTGYNAELSNLPFEDKKGKLAHTHFELTRELLGEQRWAEDEIVARGQRLAQRALLRWPRDAGGSR
jgi:hypothetical protein